MVRFYQKTLFFSAIVVLWGVVSGTTAADKAKEGLIITSTAFQSGGKIPARYTCKGEDVSPPLSWSGVPVGTQSLVLIMDDPDAPIGTWVHWVYFNIPPDLTGLPEKTVKSKRPQIGGIQGMTDFRMVGYGGPCPPSGTHRYYFKLFALDTELKLDSDATKVAVEKAMAGHILAKGTLMGKFTH
ncbi:YbhB/YbcL family Raf kinase inhibitor-like protein [bacterium]|nr:YbhB/YbcL family Raf kinase inhibitor-like protein [bacterium]